MPTLTGSLFNLNFIPRRTRQKSKAEFEPYPVRIWLRILNTTMMLSQKGASIPGHVLEVQNCLNRIKYHIDTSFHVTFTFCSM